jgi:serine/threonine protein kinase
MHHGDKRKREGEAMMTLGHYRLLTQMGASRDGVCYRAQRGDRPQLFEVHNLEAARKDAERWAWLVPRLRIAALYIHPAVIRVLELALEHDPPFVSRPWVGESSLAHVIRERGSLPEAEALSLAALVAGAVASSHSMGLVHGRIGPSQVQLDESGRPKLDFTGTEVHSIREDRLIQEVVASCQAPEIKAGSAPSRPADVYSIGALLACLLGRSPRPGAARSETGTRLDELIAAMTAADPDDRPLAHEVAQRLFALDKPVDVTGEWSPAGAPPTDLDSTQALGTLGRGDQTIHAAESCGPMLGRFQLLELLGEGGQGLVYRAQDTADGSIVALKVLRSERAARPEVLRRFRKEARLLAEANNPHVVNLLEFNEEDSVPYLVLEFVAGKTLDDLIKQQTRLDEAAALEIIADVARALIGPHERGIIHRDIKPANILLLDVRPVSRTPLAETMEMPGEHHLEAAPTIQDTAPRASFRVKLSDFGLARHVVDTQSLAMTEAGTLMGTPHYMAPEQWTGLATDPRTDVYAMGATLFHTLAGRPPFAAATRDELLAQHCHEPAPPYASSTRGSAKEPSGSWKRPWPSSPRTVMSMRQPCSATWRHCGMARRRRS